MRNSVQSETSRPAAVRDRQLFRTLLLGGAALCVTMSLLRIEPSMSSVTSLVTRGGTTVVSPLMNTLRRRINW